MAKSSTSFKLGQSGNPKGRTPKTEEQKILELMYRDKTHEALEVILQIMLNGESERNRLSAAQYILDRGWGKVKQAVNLPDDYGDQLCIEVHYVDANRLH